MKKLKDEQKQALQEKEEHNIKKIAKFKPNTRSLKINEWKSKNRTHPTSEFERTSMNQRSVESEKKALKERIEISWGEQTAAQKCDRPARANNEQAEKRIEKGETVFT